MTACPVCVEPVNMTKSTSSTTASPVSRAPTATSKTPGGAPAAFIISLQSRPVRGVTSDGFMMTALPAINAGTQSQKALTSG